MRCNIRAAAIKWEFSPSSAKGRNAAVAVLQIYQPPNTATCGRRHMRDFRAQVVKRQQGTRRIVCVGDSSRQIGPCPSARTGQRVGLFALVLLVEQPLADLTTMRVGQ